MLFEKIADNRNVKSLAARLRQKRFIFFLSLLSNINYPIKILDVGGVEQFWQVMGYNNMENVEITLLNIDRALVSGANFKSVQGDALDMKFPDESFDVVFSNSVIEHVGDMENQHQMVKEINRVAKRYFVQTPNKNFFIEPHFLFPFFQFLPIKLRIWLVMNFNLGWFNREVSPVKARELVESITLLTKKEFLALFPESKLYEEKIFGMTKSFIAYSGWE